MSALALRPSCESCGAFMEIRVPHTKEQEFCGTWYDHPVGPSSLIGHTSTVLLPSHGLNHQLGVK